MKRKNEWKKKLTSAIPNAAAQINIVSTTKSETYSQSARGSVGLPRRTKSKAGETANNWSRHPDNVLPK
jgi:hypothetical protein